ncbi:hypothetical protein SSX86_030679 [Deinandra increscens subsp. villosa]|uniref:Uncharacterized protein n=1 Tax=Deinandra increscens subsp. villosa TaxID=3103831 RepID=A0AAP0C5F4_9ASTR
MLSISVVPVLVFPLPVVVVAFIKSRRFGTSEGQWVEAQFENAKQQAIISTLEAQVSLDEAHIHLDLHSRRGISDFVVMAADAEPLENVLHLPLLAEDKIERRNSTLKMAKLLYIVVEDDSGGRGN